MHYIFNTMMKNIKRKIKRRLSTRIKLRISRRFRKFRRKRMASFFPSNQWKRIKPTPLSFAVLFLLITAIFVFTQNAAEVFTVEIDGKDMGQVRNKNEIYKIMDSVEKDLSEKYGTEVIINTKAITFSKAETKEMTPLDEANVVEALKTPKNSFLKAWAIKVNGKEVAILNQKEEAQQLLEDIKQKYMKAGSQYLTVKFKEKVEIIEININSNQLMSYDEALKYMLTGTTVKKEHVVKKGENLWTIAEKYQINIEDLLAANPKINSDQLQIGGKVSLIKPKPNITVETVEKAIISEKIQYGTTYEKTEILYEGEEEVKLTGKYGVKEIKAQVVRENGKEVSKEILDSSVIKEPEDQIVLLGEKALSETSETGLLDNPTRGMVTSVFGRRWGRMHEGIDIANKKGTPIYAADEGVVTFAGTKSKYGLTVIIDHDNNRSTLYSHCDVILVKKGDQVKKREMIAKMGATGNATGVHLHFEVRVNDIPQDPMEYVEYTK